MIYQFGMRALVKVPSYFYATPFCIICQNVSSGYMIFSVP